MEEQASSSHLDPRYIPHSPYPDDIGYGASYLQKYPDRSAPKRQHNEALSSVDLSVIHERKNQLVVHREEYRAHARTDP